MSVEKLIEALWDIPKASIEGYYPIYFNFTSDNLRKTFVKFNLPTKDIAGYINQTANSFYFISGNRVTISETVFQKYWGEISAVIIIVCQQVLVVEQMAETQEHSANAYFPWLRKAISDELFNFNASPYDYEEFCSVWTRLSLEISLLKGNSAFFNISFEKMRGASQSKRFPLSQALLSKEDIFRLIEVIGLPEISRMSNEALKHAMLQEKKVLTTRGRKLISLSWMQDEILKQLKVYSSSGNFYNRYKAEAKKEPRFNLLIKGFVDEINSGWLNRQIVLGVFDIESDARVLDQEISIDFIKHKVEDRGFAFLPFSNESDCWILSSSKTELDFSKKILVCFTDSYESEVRAVIEQYFKGSVNHLVKSKFARHQQLNYMVFQPRDIEKVPFIVDGKITVDLNKKKKQAIFFEDGLILDEYRVIFASAHLPTSINIQGKSVKISGEIYINERLMDYNVFKKMVERIDHLMIVEIALKTGEEFELKFCGHKNAEYGIGYSDKNGLIIPIGELQAEKNKFIISFGEVPTNFFQSNPQMFYKELASAKKSGDLERMRYLKNLMASRD